MTATDLRAIIIDVAEMTLEEARRRAEQELSTLTVDDWTNYLVVAGISLFGVWVMTIGDSRGGESEVEEAEDVCALCGELIDPTVGATFPGPRAQRRLDLYPGEAVCRRCAQQYRARG